MVREVINIYSEIEKRAWQKDTPKDASPETMLIYCIAQALYADFAEGNIDQEEAHKAGNEKGKGQEQGEEKEKGEKN